MTGKSIEDEDCLPLDELRRYLSLARDEVSGSFDVQVTTPTGTYTVTGVSSGRDSEGRLQAILIVAE